MSNLFDEFLLRRFRSYASPIKISRGIPVATCFKDIDLIEIPRIMREKKLTRSAALMEHWFMGKAFVMPRAWKAPPPFAIDPHAIPQVNIEESIVTMQWALGFARALAAQQELRAAVLGYLGEKSLQASKIELFASLAADGKFTNRVEQFGIGSAKILHKTAHMNTRIVSANFMDKLSDPLDDLYCSLGVFGIHVVASGTVTPIDPKNIKAGHRVTIVKLGYYIKDTYDFNEDQPLGYWSDGGVTKIAHGGSVTVENMHFRTWRTRFGHGGDFMIFSDVRWEGTSQPIIWNRVTL